MIFETLTVRKEGAVLFTKLLATSVTTKCCTTPSCSASPTEEKEVYVLQDRRRCGP
jgi:hypothetical protein